MAYTLIQQVKLEVADLDPSFPLLSDSDYEYPLLTHNNSVVRSAVDAESAIVAQQAGVDRIFYDLEYIGKADRQHGRNTVLSTNSIDDLPKIREVVNKSQLLVRTNPIHAYSQVEINKAIEYGADILMLPMTIDHHDAEDYVRMVNGRARVCIMIETASAMARLDSILEVKGVDEIFIGLNDLHISMGLTFMFELLSGGLVEYIANKCNKVGIPFGFGGIARIGEGDLPSDNILGEHVRLGSTSVILLRYCVLCYSILCFYVLCCSVLCSSLLCFCFLCSSLLCCVS